MTAVIGTCTQALFRHHHACLFEQILCEAGRAVIWEWWRAYDGLTLRFMEDRMLAPRQVVRDWRMGHAAENERLVFLFSSPDAEAWYLMRLTAWALEDSDG